MAPINLVLICLDTFRADCISAAGRDPRCRTPNIDRIVNEGVLFDNAFGEGQPTIQYRRAFCTGMRSFPFTRQFDTKGLWPRFPGWHQIPPEQPTMAELLALEGYATGMVFNAFHMGKCTQNFTRGMSSWEFVRGQETDNWRSGPLDAIADRLRLHVRKPHVQPGAIHSLVPYLLNQQDRRTEEDYLPARTFNAACRFIDDHKRYQPFMLWVDSFDPHEPWDPPREYADEFDPDWDEDWEPIFGLFFDVPEKVRRRMIANYYGEVKLVDKYLGRLLDKLDDERLSDNTVVLVTSDHGAELWDHGTHSKTHFKCRYRHNHEIALAMRFPEKAFAGARVKGFVQNQDFLPTLLDYVGAPRPPVDGLDFMPLVRGETDAVRDHIVSGWAGGRSGITASVRDHEWAWSRECVLDDPEVHLFRVPDDPREMKNVAGENPDVCAEMEERLQAYLGGRPAGVPHQPDPYSFPAMHLIAKAPWAREIRDLMTSLQRDA